MASRYRFIFSYFLVLYECENRVLRRQSINRLKTKIPGAAVVTQLGWADERVHKR